MKYYKKLVWGVTTHKQDCSLWIKDYSPQYFWVFPLNITFTLDHLGALKCWKHLCEMLESIAWISLSKGCTIPEINNVITFDYFCHNSMVSATASGFQCRLIGSYRFLCRIQTHASHWILQCCARINSVVKSTVVPEQSCPEFVFASRSELINVQLKRVVGFRYAFVSFAAWCFSYATEMSAWVKHASADNLLAPAEKMVVVSSPGI